MCLLIIQIKLSMKINLNIFFSLHSSSTWKHISLSIYKYRPLSKNIKSSQHLSDSVPQYFRGGRGAPSNKTSSYSPSSNMEFLRGVYAFMQVSRSSVSVNFFPITNQTNFLYTNTTITWVKLSIYLRIKFQPDIFVHSNF